MSPTAELSAVSTPASSRTSLMNSARVSVSVRSTMTVHGDPGRAYFTMFAVHSWMTRTSAVRTDSGIGSSRWSSMWIRSS